MHILQPLNFIPTCILLQIAHHTVPLAPPPPQDKGEPGPRDQAHQGGARPGKLATCARAKQLHRSYTSQLDGLPNGHFLRPALIISPGVHQPLTISKNHCKLPKRLLLHLRSALRQLAECVLGPANVATVVAPMSEEEHRLST